MQTKTPTIATATTPLMILSLNCTPVPPEENLCFEPRNAATRRIRRTEAESKDLWLFFVGSNEIAYYWHGPSKAATRREQLKQSE